MIKQEDVVLVAITGGIGCGQSSVAKFLEEMGAKIINADQMAHKVVNEDPEAKKEIRKNFGKKVFFRNGKLNRKLLGRIVFEDETKTKLLNKIVHPRMVSRIIDEIEEARDTGQYKIIAIDAALIYEINLEHMFDAVVVVASRLKNRIERIVERDGLSEKEIRDRISKQIPIEDKVKWADFIINNNSSLEQLKKRSANLYHKLIKKSGRR
jgi:dephospho-CoA kinase